jgi:RNA polymerase sigma-70 factor (ECF subfamily)
LIEFALAFRSSHTQTLRLVIYAVSVTPTTSNPSPSLDQHRWFAEEVHTHEGQLKAYLRGSFPTVHDVDDVVQESYLRVWKTRAAQPIRSARSFLFQVARRLAIDVLRRRRTSRIDAVCDLTALSVIVDGPDTADAVCQKEELRLLAEAIHALPARCREVMILRKIQGLSQKEIAVRLGITEGTVQIHVGRGLRHLEDYFLRLDLTGK